MASEVGVLDIAPENVLHKGRLAARPHVPGRHREGAHRRRRRDQGRRWRRASRTASGWTRTWCGSSDLPGAEATSAASPTGDAAHAPAGVRLHRRRPADPDGADGDQRPGGGRLDGHRHAAGRAVRPAAAALQLLQAAVRAGHQSADRSDPRRAGDVAEGDDRRGAEPVRGDAASTAISSELENPIISNAELAKIKRVDQRRFAAVTLPMLFKVADGGDGLRAALDELCRQASAAVEAGYTILILSDRGVTTSARRSRALLATAGGASSPDPRRHAHALRPRRRVRRAARGASLLPAADRLRRRRGQPVPRASRPSTTWSRPAGSRTIDADDRASSTTSRPPTRACSR